MSASSGKGRDSRAGATGADGRGTRGGVEHVNGNSSSGVTTGSSTMSHVLEEGVCLRDTATSAARQRSTRLTTVPLRVCLDHETVSRRRSPSGQPKQPSRGASGGADSPTDGDGRAGECSGEDGGEGEGCGSGRGVDTSREIKNEILDREHGGEGLTTRGAIAGSCIGMDAFADSVTVSSSMSVDTDSSSSVEMREGEATRSARNSGGRGGRSISNNSGISTSGNLLWNSSAPMYNPEGVSGESNGDGGGDGRDAAGLGHTSGFYTAAGVGTPGRRSSMSSAESIVRDISAESMSGRGNGRVAGSGRGRRRSSGGGGGGSGSGGGASMTGAGVRTPSPGVSSNGASGTVAVAPMSATSRVMLRTGGVAAVAERASVSWRGSLGSWDAAGAFTCPVNACETWDLSGCGNMNRPRDTKCDSCNRMLRVDWHVGAAASIGSGVDNPQLRLANDVTFQNKHGLTYQGKVVAIDTVPSDRYPRGKVRVKYNDWPYDKYDEDCPMELVTPKGWAPTPMGRAGRRQSKPVRAFSPTTESHYLPRVPRPLLLDALKIGGTGDDAIKLEDGEHGETEGVVKEEAWEVGDSDEDEEEEEVPVPKEIIPCKHVSENGAKVVMKTTGLCRICYKAHKKKMAGIVMCRHVRDGGARASGRGPGDFGKGHCRECTIAKYPLKKVKVPRQRLWPSCSMPGCRKRHYAWGICNSCTRAYNEKYPEAIINCQRSKLKSKVVFKFEGSDAEYTDSSEDDEAEKPTVDSSSGSGSARRVCFAVSGDKEGTDNEQNVGAKRMGAMTGTRQAKRSRSTSQCTGDAPVCFFCQRSEGPRGPTDLLLECADFDCSRKVHMSCMTPAMDEVPERFYCPQCIRQEKDKACENPCLACQKNDREDLMLVCDRDSCYYHFHCYCLPQPLETPPEGSYVCPLCTGDDLEKARVIAKESGGVRPARRAVELTAKDEPTQKERRCGLCSTKCSLQTMWRCCSGKSACRGMRFHRKCLAPTIDRSTPSPSPSPASTPTATTRKKTCTGIFRTLSAIAKMSQSTSSSCESSPVTRARGGRSLIGGEGTMATGVGAAGARGAGMEVRDSDNRRLCCPQCGYDRLEADVVDDHEADKAYEGTIGQERTYKAFQKALRTSLEDPRFGIGRTREEFEAPFKGSIGSGGNRTAMYGSVFEGAIDHMFRNSGLKATDKFLDIGCGIGSIVLQAAAWAGCQAAGIEIVDDRYAGAVMLHEAFHVTLRAETELGKLLHPDVVEQKVHLIEGCFLEKWNRPEVQGANFIFFNNSSGWFNNSKALSNPDEHSLEARLLNKLKNNPSNNGKILVTLEHIAEWQPHCWERRSYKYQCDGRRTAAATYAATELEFWEYTVVSEWECPGCTSLNTDAMNDCPVCGTYCKGKRHSNRL